MLPQLSPSAPALTLALFSCAASGAFALDPLMVVRDEIVWDSDFSEAGVALEKAEWTPRQGTRWEVVDGVLRGIDSSDEFQAARSHHRGYEPRISAPITPAECAMAFRIRFVGGEETAIVPFIEFGHHIVRLKFSAEAAAVLLVDYETTKVAEAADFRWKDGGWYRCLAELKGDEFVFQIEGGPTFYVRNDVIGEPAPSGGTGFGTAGPRGGMVEIDDVTVWTVGEEPLAAWAARRDEFPSFEPVQVREHPKPKE